MGDSSGQQGGSHPSRIFRRASLRRLDSPERLDQLLQVVRPRSWLALGTLGALVVIGLGWSIWGRVPVIVEGRGVLIHPRRVVELQSPVSGALEAIQLETGQQVKKGEVLGVLDKTLLRQQLAQKREELSRRRKRKETSGELHRRRLAGEREALRREKALLERQVKELREQADRVKEASETALADRRKALNEQLDLFGKLSKKLQDRVKRYEDLEKKGIVSKQILLQLEETALNALQTSQSLQTQLQDLTVIELKDRTQDMERRHRIMDLENKLHDVDRREIKLSEEAAEYAATKEEPLEILEQQVAQLESQLAQESKILSPYTGRVIEVSVVRGQVVSVGTRLGVLEAEDPERPLQSVSCFAVKDGKRLRSGLAVQVTPDTVQRQRYGSIKGTVSNVGAFPVTAEDVTKIVGNAEMAKALVPAGGAILVFGALQEEPTSPSGYAWTSSRGPPVNLTPGTTTGTRVIVELRSPLSFVLPILRSSSGSE